MTLREEPRRTPTMKYDDFDKKLIAALREPKTFGELRALLELEADKIATPNAWGYGEGWRLIDRRLQALKRSGQVKLISAKVGWRAHDPAQNNGSAAK